MERCSTPAWLKVLLLLVHLLPLVLITASSGVLLQLGTESVQHAAALYLLLMLVAVAEVVDNAILSPLYSRDACLLLSLRGLVFEPADYFVRDVKRNIYGAVRLCWYHP